MQAPEVIEPHGMDDSNPSLDALRECALASTPEALRFVHSTLRFLASNKALAELRPSDQGSAAALLAMLIQLTSGEPSAFIAMSDCLRDTYLPSDTSEKNAADEDAEMVDAEDASNPVVTKASLGGMDSSGRHADKDEDEEADNNDTDQENEKKRKRKAGSRDGNYRPPPKPRKKLRRDDVTEPESKKDSNEESDSDSDSHTSTELQRQVQRQENAAHNLAKPLGRANISSSAQKQADASAVAVLGTKWGKEEFPALCDAVLNATKALKWSEKKQDSGFRLVCTLLLSKAAENIATNVVRFAMAGGASQHNEAESPTSEALTIRTEPPQLIAHYLAWSDICARVEAQAEWGNLPQIAASYSAYHTVVLLEEQIEQGNHELITFLQQAVPGDANAAHALNQYLTPRSPWSKGVSSGARYKRKLRAKMEYTFLSALGGSAALLLLSNDSSLRAILGNTLNLNELQQLLCAIAPRLEALHGLVDILGEHVWNAVNHDRFEAPKTDRDLQPLIEELERNGWSGVALAIRQAIAGVRDERNKDIQDEAMEGIDFANDVDGTESLLSGLGGLEVGGAALEEEQATGGQSYFDEAMVASGGKEADIQELDVMALNTTI